MRRRERTLLPDPALPVNGTSDATEPRRSDCHAVGAALFFSLAGLLAGPNPLRAAPRLLSSGIISREGSSQDGTADCGAVTAWNDGTPGLAREVVKEMTGLLNVQPGHDSRRQQPATFRGTVANALLVLGAIINPGCRPEAPPPAPSSDLATPAATTEPTADKSPVTPAAKPALPSPRGSAASAVEAARTTLTALEHGDFPKALEFLPTEFQADLDGLIQEFAERMDPEIWERFLIVVRKSTRVLDSKRDWIFELDLVRLHPESERIRAGWDPAVQLLTSMSSAKWLDLARLKQATLRELLPGETARQIPQMAELGRKLGARLALQLGAIEITPVRADGTHAVIAIRGPGDEQPQEVRYVQHAGRWLPQSLVDSWGPAIARDREWLQSLPERLKAVKPQLLDGLSEAERLLDALQAADSREQFEQAAGPAILSAALAWPRAQVLLQQALTGPGQLSYVTVTINRELTERELNGFVAGVLAPLRDSGSDYTLLSNNGATVCRIAQIADAAGLCDRLADHFKIPRNGIQFQPEDHRIQVELAP